MPDANEKRSRRGVAALFVVAALLIATALAVRGIAPKKVVLPKDVPVAERPRLRDPMQLLGPAANLRAKELDALVSAAHASDFASMRARLFALRDCPKLLDWANTADGQRFERLLNDLRAGSKEDALAALVLIFRAARACEWKPGMLARTEHAEKLATWLQDWLRTRGEDGAADPLLSEPAIAAGIVYGAVMHVAWDAPVVGHKEAPYLRATAFLTELVGASPGRRTAYGDALATRFPRAVTKLFERDAALAGFAEEERALFPDLTGECAK